MTDRQSTHGHDCWSWGPKHYECAVREIERLRKMHQDAYQRGLQAGSKGLREMYDAVQTVKRQDAWGNAQLTEALMEAEERAERAEAENKQLRAEVERLRAEVARLEVIAGYGGVSSDAPERLILASEVYDGIQSCDKWCDVRRVVDDGQPMPESATAYVRADRAERLAEALKEIRSRSAMNLAMRSDHPELTALLGDIYQIADAALAQEADRG